VFGIKEIGEREIAKREIGERPNFSCLVCQEIERRDRIMVGPTTFAFLL